MTPKRADESAEEMPPRVYPEALYCVVHKISDGKIAFQKQTIFDFKPAGEHRAYVPESLLHAAKEQAKRDVAEVRAETFLRVARHARIYWGDAVADQLTEWYEEAQLDAAIALLREGKS